MVHRVNQAIKDNKIVLPITLDGFKSLCTALDMHCTATLAFEGLMWCRGKLMENSPPEDFNFDRMIEFLNIKSRIVAPASNPRIALTTKQPRNDYYPTLNGNARLPPL